MDEYSMMSAEIMSQLDKTLQIVRKTALFDELCEQDIEGEKLVMRNILEKIKIENSQNVVLLFEDSRHKESRGLLAILRSWETGKNDSRTMTPAPLSCVIQI
jgi:hypothetical protein